MGTRLTPLLASVLGVASGAAAQLAVKKVTVDPGATDRPVSVVSVLMGELRPHLPRFTGTLTSADGKRRLPVQADVMLDDAGNVTGTRVQWIQPAMRANRAETYALVLTVEAYDGTQYFHFIDTPGYRDLLYGGQPIYRYENRFDPARYEETYKPFHQVFGFHDDGFITKGAGGMESHHRGLFFGFMTPVGNFWSCKDAHQEHVGYRFETESSGPVAARSVSVVDWVGRDGRRVVRDVRDVAAYRLAKDLIVLDFDISAVSLTGEEIAIDGNAHHGGIQFRAAQEVAEQKPAGARAFDGGARYVFAPGAVTNKDDEWVGTPWAACNFTVKGNPYMVVMMDHPSNPKMTTFSARAYGRFGASVPGVLRPDRPMELKYRVMVVDPKAHPEITPETMGAWYANYADPARVTVK